ncbi:hypothetical protein EDD16DRAFT_1527736 [Pisolithus croceorrhizus]|nr:hypothetical protein EDD16DRAFT_1527736 [Pisolithus croceorrhizus]
MNFSQANEVLMTSFPTFMNSTYSHEPRQINLLQEHTKLLEGHIIKLTIENNTLRFFVEAGWSLWTESLHLHHGEDSASGWQFIHGLMENAFPDFKFANDEWKVDYLASMTYPAWWKVMLDNNGVGFQVRGRTREMFQSTALALATSKVQDIPLLSPLDTTQESPPDSMDLDNVMSNAMLVLELESTILPAATPTLSMILIHVLIAGASKPNQAYNDEATVLATSNNWDTKTICNGTLH